MRKLLLFCLLVQVALPAFAVKRITVAQLERLVAENHAKSDAKIAPRFYDLELTERLSPAKLAALEAALPGPESRRSLVALADQAAFLDPPPAEIPSAAPPDPDAQRRMMAAAVDYAAKTMHQLPNLFATRDTIHFEDSPAVQKEIGEENVSGTFTPYQPLHPVSRSSVAVLYRDGQEVVDAANSAPPIRPASPRRANSVPSSPPSSETRLRATSPGAIGSRGPPACRPSFASSCPTRLPLSGRVLLHRRQRLPPFLRLSRRAHPRPRHRNHPPPHPHRRPRQIRSRRQSQHHGRIRPHRARQSDIYMSGQKRLHLPRPRAAPGSHRVTGSAGGIAQRPTDVEHQDLHSAPLQTMLNEVVFNQYHLFRADARILTADNAPPATSHAR